MKFAYVLAALAVLSFVPGALSAQTSAAAAVSAPATTPHLVSAAPAVFESAVSSGSAQVGQAVRAKLTNPAALSNGMKLPSGSELMGHVDKVQGLSGGNGTSQLGMMFDRVKMPNGTEIPIQVGVLKSIGSGQPQDAVTPQANSPASNGGLLGGVTGAVGATSKGVVSTTGQVLGAVTALPGVLLTSNGVLGARGKDVSVPAGTSVSVGASASVSAQ